MVDQEIEQRVTVLTNAIADAVNANADIHDAQGFADVMIALNHVVVGAIATIAAHQHNRLSGAALFAEQLGDVIDEDSPAVIGLFAVRQ